MAAEPPENPQLRTIRNKRRGRAGRAGVLLAIAWLGALAANHSLVVVRGHSMLPALWPGDRVVTLPHLGRPRVGRIVVVRDPADPAHLVVKRVHAVDDTGVDVRGDNPSASTDSRSWGPLPRAAVRRRVLRRWPDLRSPL